MILFFQRQTKLGERIFMNRASTMKSTSCFSSSLSTSSSAFARLRNGRDKTAACVCARTIRVGRFPMTTTGFAPSAAGDFASKPSSTCDSFVTRMASRCGPTGAK